MDELEKVQKLKNRANVSLEEAAAALKACDGDLLDAMVYLEKKGSVKAPEQVVVTTNAEEHTTFENVKDKVERYDRETSRSFGSKFRHLWCIIIDTLKNNSLSITHKNEEFMKIPLWVLAFIMIFAWHISIVVIIVSLFFGVRYTLVGRDEMREANKLIGKAADAADYVKEKFDKL
ncbi:MAG: hypothetical protein J6O17_01755 [Eubacterium sp.]|nr:hypothetical protein [Eubacterium sp.]